MAGKMTVIGLRVDRSVADGFKIQGGVNSERALEIAGNDIKLVAQQASTITFPNAASDTLLGESLFTAKGDLLVRNGSGQVVAMPAGTNGQALVYDSASATGFSTLPIESLIYEVIDASQAAATQRAYIIDATAAARVDLSLPATAAVGERVKIYNLSANLWRITQGAGQQILMIGEATTAGATGYLESTAANDAIELVCVEANNKFLVVDASGVFNFA